MMVEHILAYTIPAAYSLLQEAMRSDKATAMIIAIGLHESDGFTARRQYNRGPARGFWQFERIGTRDVLEHPRTKDLAVAVMDALRYHWPNATIPRQAIELVEPLTHNDTLACCFARLNLWKSPKPLPGPTEVDEAYTQYVTIWKPGAFTKGTDEERRQLRAAFMHSYAEAWARVTALKGTTT